MKIIRLKGADYTEYMKNIDGARHKLNKSLWDEFGQVRITNPSGRFIGIVRQDPGEVAPADDRETIETDGSVSDSVMQSQADNIKRMKNSGHVTKAPKPRACKCAEWPWAQGGPERDDKGKPTEHHPKCAFRSLYERQKGHKIKTVAAGPTLEPTIHKAGRITNPAINRGRLHGTPAKADKLREKTDKIPMPDRCPKCKDFTKSKKMEQDQHHPTCEYYKKFKAISHARANAGLPPKKSEPLTLPVMLMNLESMEVVREAEADEVQEGRERLRDEGTAFVEVDGEQYLCMYEDGTTLEPADPAAEHADTEPPAADDVNEADDPDLQGVNDTQASA